MPINPNYIRNIGDEIETRKAFPIVLDIADTIYAANYMIGYFAPSNSASELMQYQKIQDLKRKKLWDDYLCPFKSSQPIDLEKFGVNIYFADTPNDARKKQPEYLKLLDLTSSHINFGGYRSTDLVVTHTDKHDTIKFFPEKGKVPFDEFVLGFIRYDSGLLNNKPIQDYLGQRRLMDEFVNSHILNAKVLVPTQPFGSIYRGGKLLALISQSNELRDFFNQLWSHKNVNVVLWYTMSLYGSTKDLSQYDQLDRFIKHIGNTDSKHSMRMKNPEKDNLLEWMDRRGVPRSNFCFGGSSKMDRQFQEMARFVKHCLWYNKGKDPTIKILQEKYENQIEGLGDMTEKKRCYVGTYGLDNWDDNLINFEREIKEENSLENLFYYWKKKVKKLDWGLRKNRELIKNPQEIKLELLNKELRKIDFKQVR